MSENIPLKNAKHEAFALAVGRGVSGREAYKNAGFKPKNDATADACASRLLTDAKVAARVSWLKSQVAEAVVSERVMDLEEVLAELSKLGRSNIQDIVVGGDDTAEVVQSLRDMKPEHAAAIQELTIETYVEGKGDNARDVKRVKVKLHDKRGALSELRRHHEPQRLADADGKPLGTGAAKATVKAVMEELTELERARRIAFALEKAARATAKTPAQDKTVPPKPKRKSNEQRAQSKAAG